MADVAMETADEEPSLDALDELPQKGFTSHVSDEDNDTPTTKRDIKSLLKNICSLFQADLAIVWEDMHSLTGRTLQTKQAALQEVQDKTIQAQQGMVAKLTDQEDKIRRNNIKLKGVPEEVAMAELPQYLRRLFHHTDRGPRSATSCCFATRSGGAKIPDGRTYPSKCLSLQSRS
ncbi:Hypothetical predicted protein [Pelobates cultripes]|uniref:Uncharacterized protein n=1 Tax=Pelobates cultripes TaxID=61616 RepID=A0AAD1TFA6_PELCU|nr:Hypothetical predicted protein [Pelobates cultripes]